MNTIEIQNSKRIGTKVLLLSSDKTKIERLEAKSEQDPELNRVDIYTSISIADARTLVRLHGIQLVIYQDAVDSNDYVHIQIELKGANKSIDLIPITKDLDTILLNDSIKTGNIYQYGTQNIFENYSHFKSLIHEYIRTKIENSPVNYNIIEYADLIKRSMFVKKLNIKNIKELSAITVASLVGVYDLSSSEVIKVLAGDKIYSPDFDYPDYQSILCNDPYDLLPVLNSVSSWLSVSKQPTSVPGLVITISNFIAFSVSNNKSDSEIVNTILSRPKFLLHPGLRPLTEAKLKSVLSDIDNQTISGQKRKRA